MGVEGVVLGTLQVVRNGTTNEDAEDPVGLVVGVILIKGQENSSVVHEVVILQQSGHPATLPLGGERDVGVVGVIGHVGGDERPLRKLLVIQIGKESIKALDLTSAGVILDDGIIQHEGVVLAHVVVGKSLLVGVVVALEAGVRDLLLVLAPRDTLGVQQISNGGDVGRHLVEVVIVHAESVTTSGGTVVGLRRVGDSIVVGPTKELECIPVGYKTQLRTYSRIPWAASHCMLESAAASS